MKLAHTMLEGKRLVHSIGAADTAHAICTRYGLDADAGYLAALAHDLCKRMDSAEQKRLALSFAGDIPPAALENPKLLHGPAAAVFLEQKGIITDPSMLEAIAYHTFGKPGMCDLSLAVYVADKIEPGRRDWAASVRSRLAAGAFDGPEGLRALAAATVEALLDDITSSGRIVAPTTFTLYNDLDRKSVV